MNDAQDNSFCVTLPEEIHCELTDQSAPELSQDFVKFQTSEVHAIGRGQQQSSCFLQVFVCVESVGPSWRSETYIYI
jgi:hypothetical protein